VTKLGINNNAKFLYPIEFLPLEDQVYGPVTSTVIIILMGTELGLLKYVRILSRCWREESSEKNSRN
jgi:hypothetical protein